MLAICEKKLRECLPCDDDPLLNISAEDPDKDVFISNFHYFGPYGPGATGPRLGQTFGNASCLAICTSTVSQDEADDCALRQAQECAWETWRDPNGDPVTFFGNDAQMCTKTCPDGTTFNWVIARGEIFGFTQNEADTLALSLACKRSQANKICISTTQLSFCLTDQEQTKTLQANGGTAFVLNNINFGSVLINCDEPSTSFEVGDVIRYIWSIQSGSLPAGLDLDPCTGNITGTPTSAGSSTITVRATDAIGSFQQKSITINVIEILPQSSLLPDANLGEVYLQNLSTSIGNQEQQTWTVIDGSLPDGLELTTAGVLSGTPDDTVAGYIFTVRVVDTGTNASCTKEYMLNVLDPSYLAYWKMEESSGNREDCTGNGNTLTESAAVVNNTTGLIGNAALFGNVAAQGLSTAALANLNYDPTNGITIHGWFRYVGAIGGDPIHVFTLISYESLNGAAVTQFFMVVRISGTQPNQTLQLQFTDSVGTLETVNGPIKNNTDPTFFTAWVDPADSRARVQFDNGTVLVSTNVFNLGAGHATGRVAAGANNPPNSSDHYSDECGVINKVLTASERTELYTNYLSSVRPVCN